MSARRVVAIAAPRGRHADEARPDAELVADIAAGDLAALGVVYDRHGEDVRRFLVRAGAGADADDVLHETFLALTSAAPTYDGRASAKPLLLGIAARLLRGRRRTLARWARAATAWVSAGPTESTRTPEDDASTTEEVAAFERALSRLSEEKRVVFLLSEAEDLSGEDIASALGIPIATVWTRLHYARAALRAELAKVRVRG
jgi:RNA polymerase sigma-70 factor (ECF subfamily)